MQAKETTATDVMQLVKLISISINESNKVLQDKIGTLNSEKKALELRLKQLQEKSSGAFSSLKEVQTARDYFKTEYEQTYKEFSEFKEATAQAQTKTDQEIKSLKNEVKIKTKEFRDRQKEFEQHFQIKEKLEETI